MRTFLISAVAVVACSSVAFFAGAHSGLSLGGKSAPDCSTENQTSPPRAAEVDKPAASAAAQADPSKQAPAKPQPEVRDESEWPFRTWKIEPETKGDRIYSKIRYLWIRPEPRKSKAWLGYLSLGDSVRLKGGNLEAAFAGPSRSVTCDKWYAVEPRGYVCLGKGQSSTDPDDPVIAKLRAAKANRLSPWPYRYGESRGTPVYQTVPPRHQQRRREHGLDEHLRKLREARLAKSEEQLAQIDKNFIGTGYKLSGRAAPTLFQLGPMGRTNKYKVVRKSTVAFTQSFDADGRSWLLSWDRGVLPSERVASYPQSRFHGVALSDEVQLPIAFFRSKQTKFRQNSDGSVVATKESWPRHGWVQLTEETVDHDGKRYLVSKEDGLLCSVEDVSVPRRSLALPPRIEQAGKGRRTWLDISVLKGWLVAYEYDKPVYATMVSPGRGGIPKDGVDPLETASTPVGRFRITGKFVTATMVSNASKDIVHDEVMYTQNFTGPYALHGAYWHDDWGRKKSGGCVNLAPIDARRLFAWTEPSLPTSWHSVQLATGYANALAEYQQATLVYVHR